MKLLIIIFLFSSCKIIDLKGPQTVQKTYKIFHRSNQSIVKLNGLKGTFLFPTDTLKKNDIVILKAQ